MQNIKNEKGIGDKYGVETIVDGITRKQEYYNTSIEKYGVEKINVFKQ